jgi:osmotically-inducible protein OsmY
MTKRSLPGFVAMSALFGMLCGIPATAQNSTAPDNTKVNKRDRATGEPTADQAKNTKTDRDLMKEIRKSIVDDKSLSTYGHNVKIIAQHGQVTLKGPVHSDEERRTIESKAKEVAGEGNVTNQLSVKEDKMNKEKETK